MTRKRLKFAFYWAASCGGCEIAVLDINEKILEVTNIADIVFWPVAMDVKYKDVNAFPSKYIDICFFNGAIRNSENEHMAKLFRDKAQILVAFGSCAHEGCIPGLANLHNRQEIFETVYRENLSTNNSRGEVPMTHTTVLEGALHLPDLYDTVKTLDQTVNVDYYLPGCPPPVELITKAISAIASGELPPRGAVLAPSKSVCEECPREKGEKKISKIYRIYERRSESKTCLLEQGFICMGPATRAGCRAQCIEVDYPCTGCGGPCPNEPEQGAAMLSALASIVGLDEEKNLRYDPKKLLDQVKDPVGTFYKYSLPHSILRRKVIKT